MMQSSQNLILYNGTIIKVKVNDWINNLKNIYYVSSPSPSRISTTCANYNNLLSEKKGKDFNTTKA